MVTFYAQSIVQVNPQSNQVRRPRRRHCYFCHVYHCTVKSSLLTITTLLPPPPSFTTTTTPLDPQCPLIPVSADPAISSLFSAASRGQQLDSFAQLYLPAHFKGSRGNTGRFEKLQNKHPEGSGCERSFAVNIKNVGLTAVPSW